MDKFTDDIKSHYKKKEWDKLVQYMYENITTVENITDDYKKSILKTDTNILQHIFEEERKYDNIVHFIRCCILKIIHNYKILTLKEHDELKNPTTNIEYIVTVGDTELKTKLFVLYLIIFSLETDVRSVVFDNIVDKRPHIGIDYEFRNREIALMQINFETVADKNKKTNSYIWLVNPGEFDELANRVLMEYLMTNTKMYKILHGPDSLDIPYMYNIMFNKDVDKINNFTRKVVDTRFLCEYIRLSLGEEKKCSIYEALEYFGTITEDKHKELVEIHESMGPVQDISWNIHKMSSFHVKYALYDVLFLKHYLLNIYQRIKEKTPQYVPSYAFVNPLTRFTFMERREVTDVVETVKKDVNKMNNYIIKIKGKPHTLISIYNNVVDNFVLAEVDINFLYTVGFLKRVLEVLLKYTVYHIVVEHYDVNINKLTKFDGSLPMCTLYKKLDEFGFSKIVYLVNLFLRGATKKIQTVYRN